MVVLYKTDDPARLNSTDIYVSNDEIRVDWMEYWTSIREEYSEDDELAYTIPREEYENLLNWIKTKYPDLKYNEDECKNLWWDGWWEFDDLTKELCMAIKAAFSVNVAYRHIDWFCDEIWVKTTNRNYNGWGD